MIDDLINYMLADAAFATMIRRATPKDISDITSLLLEEGANEWNYLPAEEIKEHVQGITIGETFALVAEDSKKIVGAVSYNIGDFYPQYESIEGKSKPRAYIAEVVVHRNQVGKGIGTRLLEEAKKAIYEKGIKTIYIKRHEENRASESMMTKAGFSLVDVFPDPIRSTGSKRTAVERVRFA